MTWLIISLFNMYKLSKGGNFSQEIRVQIPNLWVSYSFNALYRAIRIFTYFYSWLIEWIHHVHLAKRQD